MINQKYKHDKSTYLLVEAFFQLSHVFQSCLSGSLEAISFKLVEEELLSYECGKENTLQTHQLVI